MHVNRWRYWLTSHSIDTSCGTECLSWAWHTFIFSPLICNFLITCFKYKASHYWSSEPLMINLGLELTFIKGLSMSRKSLPIMANTPTIVKVHNYGNLKTSHSSQYHIPITLQQIKCKLHKTKSMQFLFLGPFLKPSMHLHPSLLNPLCRRT